MCIYAFGPSSIIIIIIIIIPYLIPYVCKLVMIIKEKKVN